MSFPNFDLPDEVDLPDAEFPSGKPIPKWKVEKLIVGGITKAIDLYDSLISKPRHEENTQKFTAIETRLKAIETVQTEIRGFLKACTYIAALTGFGGLVLGIVHSLKH